MSYNPSDYGWQPTSSTWEEIDLPIACIRTDTSSFPGIRIEYDPSTDHKISYGSRTGGRPPIRTTGPNEPRVEIPTRDNMPHVIGGQGGACDVPVFGGVGGRSWYFIPDLVMACKRKIILHIGEYIDRNV